MKMNKGSLPNGFYGYDNTIMLKDINSNDASIDSPFALSDIGYDVEQAIASIDISNLRKALSKIPSGCMAQVTGSNGYTKQPFLHHAVEKGHDGADIVQCLISFGVPVDSRNEIGETALHHACRYDNISCMRILLNSGANVNAKANNGKTPLHAACYNGHCKSAKLLIENRADIICKDGRLNSPMHYAALFGTCDCCQAIAEHGYNEMDRNGRGETPLHMAAAHNNLEAVKFLIAKASKPHELLSAQDKSGITALQLAARHGNIHVVVEIICQRKCDPAEHAETVNVAIKAGNLDAVLSLIKSGIKTCQIDKYGKSPLHWAVESNDLEVVRYFGGKFDINHADSEGKTPLFYAMNLDDCPEMVEVCLKELNADPFHTDMHHKTCLQYAIKKRLASICDVLLKYGKQKLVFLEDDKGRNALHNAVVKGTHKILKSVVKSCWDFSTQDNTGKTAFHLAIETKDESTWKILEQRLNAEILKIKDNNGRTLLITAAQTRVIYQLTSLLDEGCDVDAIDNDKWTSLHHAAYHGDTNIVKLLLDKGASLNLQNSNLDTALHVAVKRRNTGAVDELLSQGASRSDINCDGHKAFEIAVKTEDAELIDAFFVCHKTSKASFGECCPETLMLLIERVPEAAYGIFDSCVSYSDHATKDHELAVTYNFRMVDQPPTKAGESYFFVPSVIAKQGRGNLLLHPLIRMLVETKWNGFVGRVFSITFLLYFVYVIALTTSILDEKRRFINYYAMAYNKTTEDYDWEKAQMLNAGTTVIVLESTAFTFCLLQILVEIYQMYAMRLEYLMSPTNFLDLTLYALSVIIFLDHLGLILCDVDWKSRLTLVTIVLAWGNLLLNLRMVGAFRMYIVMFIVVFKTLVLIILIFSAVLIAFAVAFYLVFGRQQIFSNFGYSFLKVLIMFVGEVDYANIYIGALSTKDDIGMKQVDIPESAACMLVVFVTMVTLALMNLLIGLAVGDIDSIRQKAQIIVLKNQIDFTESAFMRCPKSVKYKSHLPEITIYPNRMNWFERMTNMGLGETRESRLEFHTDVLRRRRQTTIS